MRDVLRVPGMRVLIAGETISTFGDWLLLLVLGIWVKTLTGSNSLAGATLLALAVPALASPLYGWVADRFRRRPFLVAVNLLSGLALVPLLFVNDRHDVWMIFVVTVLYGVSFSITGGAFSGLIKLMVPDDLLGSANGLLSSVRQSLRLIGPLIGAGIFALVGGHVVVLIDIASFAVAAVALASIKVSEARPVRSEMHWLHEVGAGIKHVWRTPALRSTTTAIAVGMLALGAVDTIVFAFIDEGLHKPPTFLAVLVTAQGIGAIAGGLSAAWVMKRLGEVAVVSIGLLAFGVAAAILIYPSVPLAFVAMPFAGVGNAVGFVAFATLLQRRTPGPIMARVSSAADMVTSAAQTISMVAGATLIAFVDYKIIFAVIAVALLTNGGLLWRTRGISAPTADPTPTADATAADAALGVEGAPATAETVG